MDTGAPEHKVGDSVIVIERTYTNEIFEWEGEIESIAEYCGTITAVHRRNGVTHPQWMQYIRAYGLTWTKHFKPYKNLRKI